MNRIAKLSSDAIERWNLQGFPNHHDMFDIAEIHEGIQIKAVTSSQMQMCGRRVAARYSTDPPLIEVHSKYLDGDSKKLTVILTHEISHFLAHSNHPQQLQLFEELSQPIYGYNHSTVENEAWELSSKLLVPEPYVRELIAPVVEQGILKNSWSQTMPESVFSRQKEGIVRKALELAVSKGMIKTCFTEVEFKRIANDAFSAQFKSKGLPGR